jgi:hypothetical protein
VNEALAALDADVDGILEKRRWLVSQGRMPAQHRPTTQGAPR